MKKRRFLVSLLCLSAMLGVSATALTSCKTGTNNPVTPEVDYWTVTFDSMNGSKVDSQTVYRGSKATEPTAPTREGYTFEGWYSDSNCIYPWKFDENVVTGNVTLYAKWEKINTTPVKEYWTVTIDLNDGTTPTTKDVEKGKKLTGVEAPTREGYKFNGWKANGSTWTMDEAITANITIVAQWTELPPVVEYWTVTIDLNDGTTPTTKDVEKGEKLTGVEAPTREGYKFNGWKANGSAWTMEEAITDNITIVAQWTKLSDYEIFVSKGNIIYASDFTKDGEVLHYSDIGNFDEYEEAFGKWFGAVNDYDDYDDTNTVFIQKGYLNVVGDSDNTTHAQLILNPVYASVIEVKAVLQTSTVAENWSIFTIMSPFSSSEYLLNLKTNAAKEICLQTRVYNETEEEYEDSILPTSGGFVYVENKDLVIEVTFDLSTGKITVTLSQEGKAKTFTETIDKEGYEKWGLPLAFSGVQVMTAGTASSSIKIDWLAARVDSEHVEDMKEFALKQLKADYNEYDKSKYTEQLELLEKAYKDGVDAINAATTVNEVLLAMNNVYEALYAIKSDDQLEALAKAEEALQELAELKEEYKDSYTITKDSEDDYYSNKESFDELFANAINNLKNPSSVEDVEREIENVRNTLTEEYSWLSNDETILGNYRQHLVNEVRNYAYENGYGNYMGQVEEDIITPLEQALADLNTKAEMKALYAEYIELFDSIETDEQILARTKQEACTDLEEYAELALEDLDETKEIDAELMALIGNVKDTAILAINNASTTEEVDSIKNAAMEEIGDLDRFAGWSLDELILYAQMELESYIDQKKSLYQPEEEEVLNALDQVYIDHEHDFDELTTFTEVKEKLKELKELVDAIAVSYVTITYYNGEEVETITYSFGEEIEKRILVGEPDEKFVGWFEEDATEEFDFSSVAANQSYTLYAKWHDFGPRIIERSIDYRYNNLSALPETDPNDPMMEYSFDGEIISASIFRSGILTADASNENRYIKINLPFTARIEVWFENTTTNERVGFIDTTSNNTNTESSYGYVPIGKSTDYFNKHYVGLTTSDLEAGTYYVNWTGEGIIIECIYIRYDVNTEWEYTCIDGHPIYGYDRDFAPLSLNLNNLWLYTTEGDRAYLKDIVDELTIVIEREEQFHQGNLGEYNVTISYGKHTKYCYTISVEQTAE